MKKLPRILAIGILSLGSVLVPLIANAQAATAVPPAAFQSDGVFGCNQTSAAASSVGAFSASGSYVPVSDAAVELNTGYIVYLDCSLRPLVSALSQSATAALVKKILTAFNTGSNGNPQFSVNINSENLTVANKAILADLNGGVLNTLNPTLKSPVQSAIVNAYSSATQNPNAVLTCPYTGDLNALLTGQTFSWAGLAALENPACSALSAYQLASDEVYGDIANAVQNNMTQLQWGQGVYPVVDANGNVVTPAAVVLNQADQALQAGLLKTENASDIGQMVGALFAGIGAQAISSAQGLAGITQSTGGLPSYIDQVAAAASQGVVGAATNAAIATINGVLGTATQYLSALQTIANTLLSAINSLKSTEAQCWANIVHDVCTAAPVGQADGSEKCQDPQGDTLKIATSTAFSDAVIQSQITPLANQVGPQIQTAQNNITTINQIAQSITNTTSQDGQTLALEQLDQIVASNGFPSQSSVNSTVQQASSIGTSMQGLVNQTVSNWQGIDTNGSQTLAWDGSVSPGVGWCNYNSPATLQSWEGVWKVATSTTGA